MARFDQMEVAFQGEFAALMQEVGASMSSIAGAQTSMTGLRRNVGALLGVLPSTMAPEMEAPVDGEDPAVEGDFEDAEAGDHAPTQNGTSDDQLAQQ